MVEDIRVRKTTKEETVTDNTEYERRREALRVKYLDEEASADVMTGGVDHLALICSDMDATVGFYTDVLKMRLAKVSTPSISIQRWEQ